MKTEYINQLAFSTKYELKKTQKEIAIIIGRSLDAFCWGQGDPDVFDVATVEELVDICRPMQLRQKDQPSKKRRCDGAVKGLHESSNCKSIWAQFSSCIDEDLTLLPPEDMNHGKALSRVVFYSLHRHHKSMGLKLTQITNELIRQKASRCIVRTDNKSMKTMYSSGVRIDAFQNDVLYLAKNLVPYDIEHGNFTRDFHRREEYRAASCSNQCKDQVLYLDFKPDLLKENENSKSYDYFGELQSAINDFEVPDASVMPRFGSPNVTAVVGNGNEVKEFECRSTRLSAVSKKLDEMISAGSEK